MTQASIVQRIFTAAEHVDEGTEKSVQSVYRDEDLSALVEWISPGKAFEEPHSHPESAHVFVVLEGEGEALVGEGRWEKISAGQFVVQPRNKVHAMRNLSTTQRIVWVCVAVSHGRYVVEERTEQDP